MSGLVALFVLTVVLLIPPVAAYRQRWFVLFVLSGIIWAIVESIGFDLVVFHYGDGELVGALWRGAVWDGLHVGLALLSAKITKWSMRRPGLLVFLTHNSNHGDAS